MAVSLIPVIVLLIVAAIGVAGVVYLTRRQRAQAEEVTSPQTDTLRYRVPQGQDPVAVITALQRAGHDAVADGDDVVVTCRGGGASEREQVRSVIEGAAVNVESDVVPGNRVRFADE